jgi:hypothetical protein
MNADLARAASFDSRGYEGAVKPRVVFEGVVRVSIDLDLTFDAASSALADGPAKARRWGGGGVS